MKEQIKSIHYPFAIDSRMGVLMEENDFGKHVKQMIMQVLLTSPGERINRPDFGCGLRRMIFAPNSEVSASVLQVMVLQSLEKWLGNVISVSDVKVNAIEEKLEVNIAYTLKATQQRQFLNAEVTV